MLKKLKYFIPVRLQDTHMGLAHLPASTEGSNYSSGQTWPFKQAIIQIKLSDPASQSPVEAPVQSHDQWQSRLYLSLS